mmetsp:Transcript_60607/g.128363  ORF Transcript_60607/g.128363 Transcript_60607/m.128363 type:complete len:350 (+) Transcript_60607:86-1135(+)|eukprot:CAMPEP_0206453662 /NCGR_PEP_ID=MMETSP0324_2-20121206/20679_1 /ASSEMBLY_ACC=CAM_ASM_000836 /TAXON_ID=2866 /ORGANISM="Crypthecodinium cohnii, Strain Seligo" /LENGTH=349 /DNA_ID=CAMNT_0053923995 /DNA_START=30 /DNA_END=1079 /DNA_ORIENTATION=+
MAPPLLPRVLALAAVLSSSAGGIVEGHQLLRQHVQRQSLPGDKTKEINDVQAAAPAPAPAAAPEDKKEETKPKPAKKKEDEPEPFDRARRHDPHFVRAMVFKHQLRVCNAYPTDVPLDVYHEENQKLTEDSPLPYKECRDFRSPLKAGDSIQFKMADASAGTFSVSDLPNNDAVLLLIIHRHDKESSAVAFESHVFANLQNAQVAVIDTYRGKHRSFARIAAGKKSTEEVEKAETEVEDKKGKKEPPAGEELRYNSVIAVNPGLYEVLLADAKGKVETKTPLVALKHQSYVILRTGVEEEDGPGSGYPEDLVIFPKSDSALLGAAWTTFRPMSWASLASVIIAIVLNMI